ncbi:MAG: metallophosphoesterase [Balneolales bacterium]
MKTTIILIALLYSSSALLAQDNKYTPPALSDSASWTMILIPDTQSYVKFERNQPILEMMTAWISENIEPLNIKLVLNVGDLVEQNELLVSDRINGNQPSKAQWEAISKAFERLDGKVPYILSAGNHDYGFINAEDRRSNFDTYFPAERNPLSEKMLRHVGRNASDKNTLENAAFELISPHGRKFLIASMEFAPRNAMIEWAGKIFDLPQYQDHTGIIVTHAYMDHQGNRHIRQKYPLEDVNYGDNLWRKLIEPSSNIELVFAGHIADNPEFRGGVAFRSDQNSIQKQVHQMVFNAQRLGGGWHGNGGDGWIRILEFLPDNKTVKVSTFSPLFAISPTTWEHAWHRADFNDFTFEFSEGNE